MGESSSTSNDGIPVEDEIEVNPTSNLPLDCYDPSGISIGLTDGRSLPSSVQESIEKSKSHWSELREFNCGHEVEEVSNMELFQTLQRHPTWGTFFKTFGAGEGTLGTLVMGKKFAEGGQAELYDVQIDWSHQRLREHYLEVKTEWVLKVFKKGTSLRQLQAQWPQEMLQFIVDRQLGHKPPAYRYLSKIYGGTLLEDGRFAFLMVKERMDLQSFMDKVSSSWVQFSKSFAMLVMYEVAFGMYQLHKHGIVHRDLKASNVLVSSYGRFHVADYECSVGVVGTGFFRAPEILQACKDQTVSSRPELFTQAADVYSYGMFCYEILTGKLPFEGHALNDYDLVINGARPEVPQYVDGWIHKLLQRCWESNPTSRPSSKEILKIFEGNSLACLKHKFNLQRGILKVFQTSQYFIGRCSIFEKLKLKVQVQILYRLRLAQFHCFNRL